MGMNSAGPRSCNICSFPWLLGDPPFMAQTASRPAGSVHPGPSTHRPGRASGSCSLCQGWQRECSLLLKPSCRSKG